MKKIVALALCACAVPTWAADVGIGVSAESNDSTIYVPIDFGDTWRLEPFVNYSKTKIKSDGGDSLKSETLRIGTGVFGARSLGESLRLYYGGRLSYLETETPLYTNAFGTVYDDGDGYCIAPTLGFEYAFNDHVSLGGEAEWFYEDVDFGREDHTRTGTDTRLILRFRF